MVGKTTSAALRVVQIIFAAVVLGLSINAVRWQYYGNVPATNGFAAFAGAFGALAGLLGLAAIWISPLTGIVMTIVDGLSTVFFLAGGIAFAVGLHGVNCSDGNSEGTFTCKLINGGCINNGGDDFTCGYYNPSDIERRCRMAKADATFLFFGFAVSLSAAVLCMLAARTKTKGRSPV